MTNSNRVTVFGVALLLIVASLSYSFLPVTATAGQGTFASDFTYLDSRYPLNGSLQNAMVNATSVSMNMILNENIQTPIGRVPITASGLWVGTRNGSSLYGLIQDVYGTVNACSQWGLCAQATFTGQGEWNGTLTSTQGTGVFDGTITFTSSDIIVPQIQLNQPTPITGTWTADFQTT